MSIVQFYHLFLTEDEVMVELIVLRGVAEAAQESGDLYRWASQVVAQACSERRNVRVSQLKWYEFVLLLNGHIATARWLNCPARMECRGSECPCLGSCKKLEQEGRH